MDAYGIYSPAGVDPPAIALRTTQRAPRSCIRCSRRKIRCDRRFPCGQCVKIGAPEACCRETVLVRGEITTAQVEPHLPTYDELFEENQQLKAVANAPDLAERVLGPKGFPEDQDSELFERYLFDHVEQGTERPMFDPKDIILPTRECSNTLIEYDKTWNSWVHYAVQYPDFDQEHDLFWEKSSAGTPLDHADASWLALYFAVLTAALLTMDDKETKSLQLPRDGIDSLLRSWFETSLHYLHKSDFMRRHEVSTVQTIAVLGICFNNQGEYKLYKTLWSCAIRIAQNLGMDKARNVELKIKPELCRRLWWTLVICEWLSVPWHPPCVTEDDFDVPLPELEYEPAMTSKGYGGIAPCFPVHYHMFMIRVSTIYQRFRRLLRKGEKPLEDVVRDADNQLAQTIAELPPHLQPDEPQTDATRSRDEIHPWVPWQRVYLTLVLLYHRMHINRTLQSRWLVDPDRYGGPRAICLSSAKAILWIGREWTMPFAKRRQWAPTLHTYAAATCLLRETDGHDDANIRDCQDLINYSFLYLSQVESTSAVAKAAVEILRQLINGQSPAGLRAYQ